MLFVLLCFSFEIVSLGFLIIGICFKKDGCWYAMNRQYGNARIVGYEHIEQSRCHSYLVWLLDTEAKDIYFCPAGSGKLLPIGSVIPVEYALKKRFSTVFAEVHIANSQYCSKQKIGNVLLAISFLLMLAASFFLIAGFALQGK